VVEVPPPPATVSWHKSKASGSSNCVEVARTREYVWVRDSNRPDGPVVGFTRQDWAAFLVGVRHGEFDNLPA
jgi:Domain of unknown function (DUF397)